MQERLEARSALLFSDVHLSEDTPLLARALVRWLTVNAITTDAPPQMLIILGDLFEAWVGDDSLQAMEVDSAERSVIDTLAKIRNAGIGIAFMHGNRDFLVGENLLKHFDGQLLTDPALLRITQGPSIALCHGDILCTKDQAYQRFRAQVRNTSWQQTFLAQPLIKRQSDAQSLRETSEMEKTGKSDAIMDITAQEAVQLSESLKANIVLHGHTHRPGVSILPNQRPRYVLPDWKVDLQGRLVRGGGLWVDANGVKERR